MLAPAPARVAPAPVIGARAPEMLGPAPALAAERAAPAVARALELRARVAASSPILLCTEYVIIPLSCMYNVNARTVLYTAVQPNQSKAEGHVYGTEIRVRVLLL